MHKLLFIFLTFSLSIHASVQSKLDDFATPFLKCRDNSKKDVVKVYDYFEGVAGIQIMGVDYIIDPKLKYMDLPSADIKYVGETSSAEVYSIGLKGIWNVKVMFKTYQTFNTALVTNGKATPLECRYSHR